jgi:hypothetical protein
MKKLINTKDIDGNNMFIKIHNDKYFAITCMVYQKGKPIDDKYFIYGGSSHKDILAVRPDFKIFVDLHLSDVYGVPMYAIENGFYFYQILNGTANYHTKEPKDKEKYTLVLCEHLRIDLETCKKLIGELDLLHTTTEQKIHFTKFVDSQLERYMKEATTAHEILRNL